MQMEAKRINMFTDCKEVVDMVKTQMKDLHREKGKEIETRISYRDNSGKHINVALRAALVNNIRGFVNSPHMFLSHHTKILKCP